MIDLTIQQWLGVALLVVGGGSYAMPWLKTLSLPSFLKRGAADGECCSLDEARRSIDVALRYANHHKNAAMKAALQTAGRASYDEPMDDA